jgi:hypothetical protein
MIKGAPTGGYHQFYPFGRGCGLVTDTTIFTSEANTSTVCERGEIQRVAAGSREVEEVRSQMSDAFRLACDKGLSQSARHAAVKTYGLLGRVSPFAWQLNQNSPVQSIIYNGALLRASSPAALNRRR